MKKPKTVNKAAIHRKAAAALKLKARRAARRTNWAAHAAHKAEVAASWKDALRTVPQKFGITGTASSTVPKNNLNKA